VGESIDHPVPDVGRPDRRRGRRLPVTLALALLVLARLAIAAALYDPRWMWLCQDDFCRAVLSLNWVHQPYVFPADLHWLPLQTYVYGAAALWGAPEAIALFAAVSLALSTGTLLALYGLGRTFFQPAAALAACFLYAFGSWPLVIGCSAMAEPLFHFLAITSLTCFARWWRGAGRRWLGGTAVATGLAAWTRYEAWVLAGLLLALGMVRLCREGGTRRSAAIREFAWLLAPWLLPVAWIVQNLRVEGVPLVFYEANRQAFDASLSWLPAQRRGLVYPQAFACLSLPVTGLLVAAIFRPRSWRPTGASLLWTVAAAHFAILTALYCLGTGPRFVERIVLFHWLILLPLAGRILARWIGSPRRILRAGAVLCLAAVAVWEPHRARAILRGRTYAEYHDTAGAYLELGRYIRASLPDLRADVAVWCHDSALFVRTVSRAPWRVKNVEPERADSILAHGEIEMLCVPRRPVGPLRPDPRLEAAFRRVYWSYPIEIREFGDWRVLRIWTAGRVTSAGAGSASP